MGNYLNYHLLSLGVAFIKIYYYLLFVCYVVQDGLELFYVVQASVELAAILFQAPNFCDYMCWLPCLAVIYINVELHILGKDYH